MFMHLQQIETRTRQAGSQAAFDVPGVPLNSNCSLLLGLSIIPALSGVVKIA
jgi:hypothetical protein